MAGEGFALRGGGGGGGGGGGRFRKGIVMRRLLCSDSATPPAATKACFYSQDCLRHPPLPPPPGRRRTTAVSPSLKALPRLMSDSWRYMSNRTFDLFSMYLETLGIVADKLRRGSGGTVKGQR